MHYFKTRLLYLIFFIPLVLIIIAPMSPSSMAALTPDDIAFTNAPNLLAKAASEFSIAAAVVLLRIYVRTIMVRSFGKDDWAMLAALVSEFPMDGPQLEELTTAAALYRCIYILRARNSFWAWEISVSHSDGPGRLSGTTETTPCAHDLRNTRAVCREDLSQPLPSAPCGAPIAHVVFVWAHCNPLMFYSRFILHDWYDTFHGLTLTGSYTYSLQ
jgi:hypothetical protein